MCTLRELQNSVRNFIEKVRTREETIISLKNDLAKKDKTIAKLRSKLDYFKKIVQVMTEKRNFSCSDDLCFMLPHSFTQPHMAFYDKSARKENKHLGGEINVNFELDSVGGSEDSSSEETNEENSTNSRKKGSTKSSLKRSQITTKSQDKNATSTAYLQLPLSSCSNQKHQEECIKKINKTESKTGSNVAKSCFEKSETSFKKSKKGLEIKSRGKTAKKSSKNKYYDLLKTGNTLSSPDTSDYRKMEGSDDESKAHPKTRNKSRASVHNWLKKHAKKKKKSNAGESIDDCLMTSAPEYAETSPQSEIDFRKRSFWKKGLSYVWPPKPSSPKHIESPITANSQDIASPFDRVYDDYQTPPALSSVAVQTSPLFTGYPFQHDSHSCLYADQIEQAYLQCHRDKMAYLERIGAEHFVLANLQQAAVLEEQTRVARLNHCFFLRRLAESWKLKNAAEVMECQETGQIIGDSMDIDPPSPANTKLFSNIEPTTSALFGNVFSQPSHQSMEHSDYPFEKYTLSSNVKTTETTFPKSYENQSISNDLTSRKVSQNQFFSKIPQSSSLNRLGKCRRKSSQKHFLPKASPTNDESAFGLLRKRLKRNAISAEPISYNNIKSSCCFKKQQPYLIPKSQV